MLAVVLHHLVFDPVVIIEVKLLARFVVIVFRQDKAGILHPLLHSFNIVDNHSDVIKPANRMIGYFFRRPRCWLLMQGKVVIFGPNVNGLARRLAVSLLANVLPK